MLFSVFTNKRSILANRYLSGSGIEIGALHRPLKVPKSAHVAYVDRQSNDELRRTYPELNHFELVSIDRVDNGESLDSIPAESLDFIIANHMIEHCENPISTLSCHFNKLVPGGIAYYAIPDRDFTFDRDRPLTTVEHLEFDFLNGPASSRAQHFYDIAHIVEKRPEKEAEKRAKYLAEIDYSIHFHVWNRATLKDFLLRANALLGNIYTLKEYAHCGDEIICILQKQADPELEAKIRLQDAVIASHNPYTAPQAGNVLKQLRRVYARCYAFLAHPEVRKNAKQRVINRLKTCYKRA